MRTVLAVLLALSTSLMTQLGSANASDFDLTFERGKSYGVVSNSVVRGERCAAPPAAFVSACGAFG